MFWRLTRRLLLFALLTVVTQVGGLIYLAYYPIGRRISKQVVKPWHRRLAKLAVFGGLLLIVSFFLVPAIAKPFGRVPLPIRMNAERPLRPGNWFFVIANRHYVKPELRNILLDAAGQLATEYPGAELRYLDAGFPFWTGFPLLPHLSHDDGEKADIAFVYRSSSTEAFKNQLPTLLGYGFYTGPEGMEPDAPARCDERGYWQYDLLGKFALDHPDFKLHQSANTCLLKALARDRRVGKIFIEPHLKLRLQVNQFDKIRFHGCRAVRHDDHIHVQL